MASRKLGNSIAGSQRNKYGHASREDQLGRRERRYWNILNREKPGHRITIAEAKERLRESLIASGRMTDG